MPSAGAEAVMLEPDLPPRPVVLIVDDNQVNAELLRFVPEKPGYSLHDRGQWQGGGWNALGARVSADDHRPAHGALDGLDLIRQVRESGAGGVADHHDVGRRRCERGRRRDAPERGGFPAQAGGLGKLLELVKQELRRERLVPRR